VEAVDALREVRVCRAHDRRDGDAQDVGDGGAALAAAEQSDGVEAHHRREVAGLAADPHQLAALRPVHSGYNVHAGLLVVRGSGDSQTDEGARLFPSRNYELIEIRAR
jgi:hypothetical protein